MRRSTKIKLGLAVGVVIVAAVAVAVASGHPRPGPSTTPFVALPSPTVTMAATPALRPTPEPSPVQAGVLPDGARTPGAVSETTIAVVCHRSTKTVRPPESYTERLKREQIIEYGYTDTRLGDYEEDHLIPLELGGDPVSPKNLWPEPHYTHPNSSDKDKVENAAHRAVCDGTMRLADAQQLMASNWITLGRELGVL